MKKLRPYFLFSIISILSATLLSIIFRFSLTNTWQSGVTLVFTFGPYFIYAWKFSKTHNTKYPYLCSAIRFFVLLSGLGFLIASLMILA
jgi:hypothetical protein